MTLKTQIIDKCKTEKSRSVLLSQLALIERGVKENGVLKKVNGDQDLAIKTQLHWELHDLNSGGNKTMAVEHIAGLVGLILMTRAWEGYLTGTGISSSHSFKAFLQGNGLDLEHVQYCLDKSGLRELLIEYAQLCASTKEEVGNAAAAKVVLGSDRNEPQGASRQYLRALQRLSAVSDYNADVYKQYISGSISLNRALTLVGYKSPDIRNKAGTCINKLCPRAQQVRDKGGLVSEQLVQFALNYVVDQFKDGIPPELLSQYVDAVSSAESGSK